MSEPSTETPKFQIGDRVQFMHSTSSGSSMSFSTREGKIIALSAPEGTKAHIQMRNGRKTWANIADLRNLNEKSPVNDIFNAICAGTKKSAGTAAAILLAACLCSCDPIPRPSGEPQRVGKLSDGFEVWCIEVTVYGSRDRIYILKKGDIIQQANTSQQQGKTHTSIGIATPPFQWEKGKGIRWETNLEDPETTEK